MRHLHLVRWLAVYPTRLLLWRRKIEWHAASPPNKAKMKRDSLGNLMAPCELCQIFYSSANKIYATTSASTTCSPQTWSAGQLRRTESALGGPANHLPKGLVRHCKGYAILKPHTRPSSGIAGADGADSSRVAGRWIRSPRLVSDRVGPR